MNVKVRRAGMLLSAATLFTCVGVAMHGVGQVVQNRVLAPITQGNLTVYPVTAEKTFDTSRFLTLDEGIRSGQVIVTEMSQTTGLVRPRPSIRNRGPWDENPWPIPGPRPIPMPPSAARVNELALVNNSDRPLILLAGEIVTGGKQDRIVGKDRIVPAHGQPVSLDVFCVEPHRWTETSMRFGSLGSSMAQPSVRSKAMAARDQQKVWDAVAQSREAFAAATPANAGEIAASSSYAKAMQNGAVQHQLDAVATPVERSYDELMQHLRTEKAVGAVVAVNREIIWADVFASPDLLEKYWPKLIRSYAAEAITPRIAPTVAKLPPSPEDALRFLDDLKATHENVETEPGVYRNTEMNRYDFEAFLLTSLLPNTGFQVHVAKMKR